MITDAQITPIGCFGKPHGINGEINMTLDVNIDPVELSCIVISVDGINVPFFFSSIRQRGNESFLVKIDGVDSEKQVEKFVNNTIYALAVEVDAADESEDGFYAEDLIGFTVNIEPATSLGTITGVDDSTDNVLFIVTTSDGKEILVPVVDEFIEHIDIDSRTVLMSLPDGLLSL